VGQVALVHTHFVSVAKLVPTVSVLVPVEVPERKEGVRVDYLYEPEPEEVLARLLPRYVEAEVYAAVLDNLASFYAAQMIAMRNATDNAGELITDLTLLRNNVRQATITKELSPDHCHGQYRWPDSRHGSEGYGRPDHRPGRQVHPGANDECYRSADRREGPDQVRSPSPHPPAGATGQRAGGRDERARDRD